MIEVFFWTTSLRRSFGIVISVSTWAFSSSAAFSATRLALRALERERLRHDADRQRPGLLRHLGDDRRGAGAGPTAQPGGDEDHVRAVEGLGDLLGVLLRRPLADRAVAAGPEAARDLVADPDLVGRVGLEQGLRVGVAGDELHAHHLGPDHPVDGVAASAADADDADQREVLGIGTQRHRLSSGGCPGPVLVVVAADRASVLGHACEARSGWRGVYHRVAGGAGCHFRDIDPVRLPTAATGGASAHLAGTLGR